VIIPNQNLIMVHFPELKAFRFAVDQYKDFKMPFWEDFIDYCDNGFVCIRPNLFVMGKAIDLDVEGYKGKAWFVRYAIGELVHLLSALPFQLPRIVWCRRDEPRLRVYKTERLFKIATARKERCKNGR
jgi:hypothetical protein